MKRVLSGVGVWFFAIAAGDCRGRNDAGAGPAPPAEAGPPSVTRPLRIAMIAKSASNPSFVAARTGAENRARELTASLGRPIRIEWLTPPQEDGTRVYQGGNGNSMSLAGSPAWTDQTLSARVKVTQFGGISTSYRAGIVARATDTSNLYVFAIDASGALRLLKGTSSPSGTGASGKVTPDPPAAANTWYTMQIKVVGTSNNAFISTFFNGRMIHDCQTSVGTLSTGAAGTYIYGPNTIAEFDDVRISTP